MNHFLRTSQHRRRLDISLKTKWSGIYPTICTLDPGSLPPNVQICPALEASQIAIPAVLENWCRHHLFRLLNRHLLITKKPFRNMFLNRHLLKSRRATAAAYHLFEIHQRWNIRMIWRILVILMNLQVGHIIQEKPLVCFNVDEPLFASFEHYTHSIPAAYHLHILGYRSDCCQSFW